jgi:hypothetical protein
MALSTSFDAEGEYLRAMAVSSGRCPSGLQAERPVAITVPL